VASRLARQMIASGETLETLPMDAFAHAFTEAIGRPPAIGERRFREIATPEHFIAVRDMFGGPAASALAASLARYRAALAGVTAARGVYEARIAAAAAELDRLVATALAA
jgi:argininosuccinate lyase